MYYGFEPGLGFDNLPLGEDVDPQFLELGTPFFCANTPSGPAIYFKSAYATDLETPLYVKFHFTHRTLDAESRKPAGAKACSLKIDLGNSGAFTAGMNKIAQSSPELWRQGNSALMVWNRDCFIPLTEFRGLPLFTLSYERLEGDFDRIGYLKFCKG